jgi:hypothetical protein
VTAVVSESRANRPVAHGGAPTLVVLVGGSDDLRDSLLSTGEGGRKLERGLAQRVAERTDDRTTVQVRRASATTSEGLLADLRADRLSLDDVDIVILSVASDVVLHGSAAEASARYESVMAELAGLVKESGAHLIVFNASSFDPVDTTSCYSGVDDTPALFIQQLNRSLIRLSVLDGLSIIDADRLISEIGGQTHVDEVLVYSAHACDLLGEELVRVLDDYGFFDDRPLLAQVGRRER